MFTIQNIRIFTQLPYSLTEYNHISQYLLRYKPSLIQRIINLFYSKKNDFRFSKAVVRTRTTWIYSFTANGETVWCKYDEGKILIPLLQQVTKRIKMWYVVGSISPTNNPSTIRASGYDGYEVHALYR